MGRFGAVYFLLMVFTSWQRVSSQTDIDQLVRQVRKLAPEVFRRTRELIAMNGYPVEEHTVKTKDGFLLTMFRIPARSNATTKSPVFLQHGLSSSSDTWVYVSPDRSLAFALADRGYDVWLGNARGNVHSRKHATMTERDPAFWNFSFHEMGMYDIPAALDYILETTGQKNLYYVGHSMGNTMMYVTLTMRPEYNSKVRLLISLAPAIFVKHVRSTVVRDILANYGLIKGVVTSGRVLELLPASDTRAAFVYYMCRDGTASQRLCEDLLFRTVGDSNGLNRSEIPMIFSHANVASPSTLFHFAEMVISGRFEQRNLGAEQNKRAYGSSQPPQYDLQKLSAPVALHYSDGDYVVVSKDVERLSTELPNVVEKRKIPSQPFNHLDYQLHRDVGMLLNDHVLKSLETY